MRSLLPFAVLLVFSPFATAADPIVVHSVKSGPWSAGSSWEGNTVPGAGARVLIREGHVITYDVKSDTVIRGINVAGTLTFDPTKDTVLNVGLIKIQSGDEYSEEGFDCDAHSSEGAKGRNAGGSSLLVGTPEKPIVRSATIRLHFVEGLNKDSCPAIICCSGRWESHGQSMNRTWVKLGATAKVGDTAVSVAEPVTGWSVGDRILITGSQTHGSSKTESFSEERTIEKIEGTKIAFEKPLAMSHLGEGDYRVEVANLSRNVVVESANPDGVRGHTMFHKGSRGSLTYSEFRELGKKDALGRYSLHFHLCRDTMRGSAVIGNSIHHSHNRWLTIHGTDYLVARDNVGYLSVGHGFFLEDGTEVFNILDRNLAVGAKNGKRLPKQVLPFDGNEGAGFWWTCSLNSFTRNVAAECGTYGFRYEATPSSSLKLLFAIRHADGSKKDTDPRTLPFVRFEDNEVHSSKGLYGVNLGEGVNRVGPDTRHPFIVKNLKIWDVHYGFRPQVPNLLVENLTIHKVGYGIYHPNYENHVYRNVLISHTDTEPFNRGHDDLSVQYGRLTVDGLTFDGCRSGGMPLVQISDDNPTGKAETHFRNVKTINWNDNSRQKAIVNLGGGPRPQPKTDKGVSIYIHDWFGLGRTALVVSSRSPEFKSEPDKYRSESPLTGDESRVAEVKDVSFPQLLEPVDDLPPATVITSVVPINGKLLVRGTCSDNGTVKKVTINGIAAKSTTTNFAEWEAELEGDAKRIEAQAEDVAGNVEKTPAIIVR